MTIVSDNFDRANETPLASPWTLITTQANANLVTNKLQAAGTGNLGRMYHSGITPTADQYAKVMTITQATGNAVCGVLLRSTTTANPSSFYEVYGLSTYSSATGRYISKVVAGALSDIGNLDGPLASGDVIEGQAIVDHVYFVLNGNVIVNVQDASIASGRIGIMVGDPDGVASAEIDTFEGGDAVPSPFVIVIKQSIKRGAFF